MEVGEITEEILELEMDLETYYLIFRREEHIPERIADFEEVRDFIEPSVKREKNGSESLNGWQKSLRQVD